MLDITKYNGENFLVCRDAFLGDVIISLCAISSIKKKYPFKNFDFLTMPSYVKISSINKDIDSVISIDDAIISMKDELDCLPNCINWSYGRIIDRFDYGGAVTLADSFMIEAKIKGAEVCADDLRFEKMKKSNPIKKIGISLCGSSIPKSMPKYVIDEIIGELLEDYMVFSIGGCKSNIVHDNYVHVGFYDDCYELLEMINDLDLLITADSGPMHLAYLARTPFCVCFLTTSVVYALKHVIKSSINNYKILEFDLNKHISSKKIISKSLSLL